MNEKGFDFLYEIFCNYCTELQYCNKFDTDMLAEIRKLLRLWHENYKQRLTKEIYLDE